MQLSETGLETTAVIEPVNFSWEEQQEGNKEYGKTTEEILKMIEDEADDEEEEYEAPEDQTEDVIDLDSDEDEDKEAIGTAEVVGISDDEDDGDGAGVTPSQESVLVEDDESPALPPAKAASGSLLLFSTFGAEQNEEEDELDHTDNSEEVEIKVAKEDEQDEHVISGEACEEQTEEIVGEEKGGEQEAPEKQVENKEKVQLQTVMKSSAGIFNWSMKRNLQRMTLETRATMMGLRTED